MNFTGRGSSFSLEGPSSEPPGSLKLSEATWTLLLPCTLTLDSSECIPFGRQFPWLSDEDIRQGGLISGPLSSDRYAHRASVHWDRNAQNSLQRHMARGLFSSAKVRAFSYSPFCKYANVIIVFEAFVRSPNSWWRPFWWLLLIWKQYISQGNYNTEKKILSTLKKTKSSSIT